MDEDAALRLYSISHCALDVTDERLALSKRVRTPLWSSRKMYSAERRTAVAGSRAGCVRAIPGATPLDRGLQGVWIHFLHQGEISHHGGRHGAGLARFLGESSAVRDLLRSIVSFTEIFLPRPP